MDPLLISALITGLATVAGNLLEKRVLGPALDTTIQKVQGFTQSDDNYAEGRKAVEDAISAAINDAMRYAGETGALQYFQRIRLHEVIEKAAIREEMMRLVFLATSDDPTLVPDALLDALHLNHDQRPSLANLLFYLHRRLNALPDFQPLLEATRDQAVVTELKGMARDLSALAGVIDDGAMRVRLVEPTWNPEPYLRYLANECNRLRLSVIDPQYVKPSGENRIALIEVYTDLEVTTPAPVKQTVERRHVGKDEATLGSERERRLTALEAVSEPLSPRVVLLGDPGGGKSTFVNYLALCLTNERLEPQAGWMKRLHGWMQAPLLPVRIVLRELIAWVDTQSNPQAHAKTLWDFVAHDLVEHGLDDAFKPLKRQLLERGGLVLLDGLDEVPDAHARRTFVKDMVEDFARSCSLCRFVVTSRPYAYREQGWKLEGFSEHTLAPFSAEQIEGFVGRWYTTVAPFEGWNKASADAKADELIAACRQPYLFELAERPLLLTLMATLHTSRGKLPDDRAMLYQDCVTLMLDYWQRGKGIAAPGQAQTQDGVLSVLGLPRDTLEQALSQVAFEAHQRPADRKAGPANISGEELRRALAPSLGNSLDKANSVIAYIQTRAGLLAEHGVDQYTFPHRTFQEFLAARYVLNSEHVPYDLAQWVREDRDRWREVYLLAVGRVRSTMFGQAVALINALCATEYEARQTITDEDALAALLAAQAACEVHLYEQTSRSYQQTRTKLQNWLVGIIAQGALPPVERAEAGRWLSALGDPRADVTCDVPVTVPVGAGEFTMGSDQYDDEKPQHLVRLSAYRIGKYPVTNAQYRRFVADDGYMDKWRRGGWTEAGWRWREENQIEKPEYWDNPQWNLDNHPVVGVSWYEAVAYCNWLSKTTGRKFHLPTEAEWEKAARGEDGRAWPWGNEFDTEKANTAESNISRTTAVGLFPYDKSPYQAYDMAGNVIEWCSSQDKPYPYRADDGREDLTGDHSRQVRGGSWDLHQVYARCANRYGYQPDFRLFVIGFRVAES